METKKFRRIYWVTEELNGGGASRVTGVYTSVPDLCEKGFAFLTDSTYTCAFRISLVALDKPGALGVWTSPDFGSLRADLEEYHETGELAEHDLDMLSETVSRFLAPLA
jgi:hypothetical protein